MSVSMAELESEGVRGPGRSLMCDNLVVGGREGGLGCCGPEAQGCDGMSSGQEVQDGDSTPLPRWPSGVWAEEAVGSACRTLGCMHRRKRFC